MARTDPIEVLISARDEASKTIDRLASRLDGLESDETRVIVTAQIERLESQLQRARDKLETLDGDEATVQARLVGNIEQDLDDARQLFNQLDGETGRVRLEADTGNAERELGKIEDILDGIASKADEIAPGLGQAFAGLKAGGPVAAGIAAIGAGFALAANEAAETTLAAETLAGLTGASTEDAYALSEAWKITGGSAGDLLDVVLQTNDELQRSPELAQQLGVAFDPNNGLNNFVEGIRGVYTEIDGAAKRGQALSALFGEEGARQVQRWVSSFEGVDEALAYLDTIEAPDLDPEQAREYKQNIAEVQREFSAMATTIGTSVLPLMNELVSDAAEFVDRLSTPIEVAVEVAGEVGDWFDDVIPPWAREAGGFWSTYLSPKAWFTGSNVAQVWDDLFGGADEPSTSWAAIIRDRLQEAIQQGLDVSEAMRRFGGVNDEIAGMFGDVNIDFDVDTYEADKALKDLDRTIRNLGKQRSEIEIARQLEELAANAETANEKIKEGGDEGKEAMRDFALEVLDAKESVIGYISELDRIPPEQRTELIAQIEQAGYNAVIEFYDLLSRGIDVPIRLLRIGNSGDINWGDGGPIPLAAPGGGTPAVPLAAAPTQNITQNIYLPPGVDSRDVASAEQRYARINGGTTRTIVR